MLGVIRSGGIERLVTYRLDRLSRNLRHFTTLFEELKDHDVELDVVTAPDTGAVALDTLMLNILASFSEFEQDFTASRIVESRASLKAHGRRIGGATPFGYFADPRTKQLVVCEEEAEVIVRLFTLADRGLPPSVIAKYANALRWITGGGNRWTARQVLAILTNHTYAGLVEHGNKLHEGCHQALVDRELYARVQDLTADRRTGPPRQRGGRATFPWVLRGILFCCNCGLADGYLYRALRLGSPMLLPMPIHGGWSRGVRGRHDLRRRSRGGSSDRNRRRFEPGLERADSQSEGSATVRHV